MIRTLTWSFVFLGAASGCNPAEKAGASTNAHKDTAAAVPTKSGAMEETERCSQWVSGQDAMTIVAKGGILLDVRTPQEYAEGHLDGALNIPVDELERRLNEVDRDTPVVVYCKSGRRSRRAAALLNSEGHNVSDLGHLDRFRADVPPGCDKSGRATSR